MIRGDFVQFVDERDVSSVLIAVEDALKDGLMVGVDVVVLQDTEDVGDQHWVECNIYCQTYFSYLGTVLWSPTDTYGFRQSSFGMSLSLGSDRI